MHPYRHFRIGLDKLLLRCTHSLVHTYPATVNVGEPNWGSLVFLIETGLQGTLAEIGVYHGATSEAIARYLNGKGELHLFDFTDRVDDVVARLKTQGINNVQGFGSSRRWLDSYNWQLMKVLQEHSTPIYDYVLIDGAHTWNVDGFTFFLIDRLLRPGGYIDFDDHDWTMAASPSLRPETFPATEFFHTPEQIETPQVSLIVDLLVRRDPRYEEIVPGKVFRKTA